MLTYVNGEFMSDEEAKISVFDRGFMFGDGVFEIERTFDGTTFKLDEHLERLRRSLRFIELDGDALVGRVRDATLEVLTRNEAEVRAAGDVWVHQIVTGGLGDINLMIDATPSIIVMLRELHFDAFAPLYDGGIDLHPSLLTRHFAGAVDRRVKATSRGAWVRAERKTKRANLQAPEPARQAMTVVVGDDGSIPEVLVANLCILTKGRIVRPPRADALEGVSLDTFCELAEKIGLEVVERKIGVYDIINADATFITATSFCVVPALSVDGIALDQDRDIYIDLLNAWIDYVGFDFVSQARQLSEPEAIALRSS